MKWSRVRLADVAKVVMGQSPPGETYNKRGDGLPFFQGKADFGVRHPIARNWCSAPSRVAEAGDILLSVRAPVGPTNVALERSCIGRGLAAIRAESALVDQDYLRFFFRYHEPVLSLQGQGSTFAAIRRAEVEGLELPLPPLSEQGRIVEILDQADRLRPLRDKADAKADRVLPALLAQAVGAPASWASHPRSRPLGDLVNPLSGATPSKKAAEYWNGDVPWVSPKDMKRDFIADSEDHVSHAALEESNLIVVEPGNVLIVVRGMILARDIPVAVNLCRVTINQDMKALVPKTTEVSGLFLWAVLRLAKTGLQSLVRTAGHGTRKLDTPDLMQFPVVVPLPGQLAQINSAVGLHRLLVDGRRSSKEMINRLFAVLLRRAFDGSLTASWREAHMSELLREMEHQARTLAVPVRSA